MGKIAINCHGHSDFVVMCVCHNDYLCPWSFICDFNTFEGIFSNMEKQEQ